MKFMLMMHAPRGEGDWQILRWPPEALKAHIQFMKNLNAELKESGELVGCEGLAEPARAKIVRANARGFEVTDEPFAEAKEFLAGYWIVDCDTAERAYAIAGKASTAPGIDGKPIGIPIEVREVMKAPPV